MTKIDKNIHNMSKRAEQLRKEAVVAEVLADFESRRNDRRTIECGFALDMNFALGNQHAYVTDSGETQEDDKIFSWESRDVFNHVAPLVETRLAKLSKVRPSMHVRPVSGDDEDVLSAKMSTALLNSTAMREKLDELVSEATLWSEVCGTAFYKVTWNGNAGCIVGETEKGEPIFEGDVVLQVCPPFEIFPDSGTVKDISACRSIIHARACHVDDILQTYGIVAEPEDVDVFGLSKTSEFGSVTGTNHRTRLAKTTLKDHALVVELFEMPSQKYVNGRMVVVAGGQLAYEGELPYVSPCGKRYLPFVRQISLPVVGSFWGTSVVERCIPLQRAYNSIRNRKHELLSRLAAGVLVVEDGSVDTDALEEDGLAPGKVVVYRNGSTPPRFMDDGSVPSEFTIEENRILDEFVSLSGVSEFSRSSVAPSNVTSGVALGLLVEQDDTRLADTADRIRFAIREIARQILCAFKRFGTRKRLLESAGKTGDVEVLMFESSHISSDDVCLDTENEMTESPSSRKAMVLDLLKYGLLNGENGKMDAHVRAKVLEALGFGSWENASDLMLLHSKRAQNENYGKDALQVLEIDDHELHIEEHTKWVLENVGDSRVAKLLEHIKEHKAMQVQQKAAQALQ